MSTAPYVLGGIAALAIVKTFFRPHRVVVREGAVSACPGDKASPCDPSLAISTPQGTPVYSTVSGRVVAVGDKFLLVAALYEPVIVMLDGVEPVSGLVEDEYVGRGECVGYATGTRVYFSVTEFMQDGSAEKIDPSSWLASRGQRIAAKYTGPGTRWCEGGRTIDVPAAAGRACDLYEPEKGSFALLPVSVSVER